ncbi:hypothetical protein LguiB_014096 [Lonicera macranthoides]
MEGDKDVGGVMGSEKILPLICGMEPSHERRRFSSNVRLIGSRGNKHGTIGDIIWVGFVEGICKGGSLAVKALSALIERVWVDFLGDVWLQLVFSIKDCPSEEVYGVGKCPLYFQVDLPMLFRDSKMCSAFVQREGNVPVGILSNIAFGFNGFCWWDYAIPVIVVAVYEDRIGKSAVSGLNRGLIADEDDLQKADAAAKEIEAAGGIVDLPADLDKLQGRWRLIYSSAFSSRTLGGSRPGPPIGRLLPITLGQVFQRIDIFSKDFDNIVDLELGTPWPVPPIEVTATLAHKFRLEAAMLLCVVPWCNSPKGSSRIRILFEKTTVKTTGTLSQLPPLEIPQLPDALRPPANRGTGEFEVTYIDSDTRITRGDRGELRVFLIA